jgi:hypothetical protein
MHGPAKPKMYGKMANNKSYTSSKLNYKSKTHSKKGY